MPPKFSRLFLIAPAAAWAADPVTLPAEPETHFDVTPHIRPAEAAPPVQAAAPANDAPKTLSLSSEELAQRPELLQRAMSSSVLLENGEAVKMLLPLYLRLPENQRDKVLTDLAQAQVSRMDGKAGKAAAHYRRVLEQEPNLPKIRYRLAQSQFEDRQNLEAQAAFEQIRQDQDTPPAVAEAAAQYLDALKKRGKARIYAGAHYTRDSNINNVPKKRSIVTANGSWTLNPPESAQGIAYRAGAEKDLPIKGNHNLRLGAELSGKYYWDNRKYDDLRVRVYGGGAFRNARSEAALLPYYERRWYGGSSYSAERGVRAEGSHWFTPKHQVLAAAEAGREAHVRRSFLDGRVANVSATWLYAPSSENYFTAGADFSRKNARDRSDAYRRRAVRLAWTRDWGKGFNTTLTADIGRREYDGSDLFNIFRKDREYTGTMTVWNNKIKLWGVTPRLVGVYHRNKSNHFMYDYRKAYGYVQLSKAL